MDDFDRRIAEHSEAEQAGRERTGSPLFAKSIVTLILLLAAAAVGGYVFFKGKTYTISITEAQIQEKLNAKFPMERRRFVVLLLTLSNPELDLVEGSDRIAFSLDAVLNIRVSGEEKPLGGHGKVTTGIRYDSKTCAFYLTDPILDEFEVHGAPIKYANKANEIARELAEDRINATPIYKLKRDDLKQAAARLLLKDVVVKNENLVVTLGL